MKSRQRPSSGLQLLQWLTPQTVDWLVFVGAAVAGISGVINTLRSGDPSAVKAVVTLALPLISLPLLWRRGHPGWVLAMIAIGFAGATLGGADLTAAVGLGCGSYAAAVYGDHRVRLAAGAPAALVLVLAFIGVATGGPTVASHLVGVAFGYGVAWVVGDRTRADRAYLAELEQHALRLERDRDEQVQLAAAEERLRIARELHDVVTHSVSIIAVQAGAARVTAEAEPTRAVETPSRRADSAEHAGRAARSARSPPERGLIGSAARTPTDAQSARPTGRAGLRGRYPGNRRCRRTIRPLPGIVDLCAFRIIQEALTNVVRHAPRAHAHVLTRYEAHGFSLSVEDDGPGAAHDDSRGSGLIGMQERVALVGGELRISTAPGHGFRVEARLPTDEGHEARPAATCQPAQL